MRLRYTIKKLHKPTYSDLSPSERKNRLDVAELLLRYYAYTTKTSPEELLNKVLDKPAENITKLDCIYAGILYHWIRYKSIKGY